VLGVVEWKGLSLDVSAPAGAIPRCLRWPCDRSLERRICEHRVHAAELRLKAETMSSVNYSLHALEIWERMADREEKNPPAKA
jgi:hypothetical protein